MSGHCRRDSSNWFALFNALAIGLCCTYHPVCVCVCVCVRVCVCAHVCTCIMMMYVTLARRWETAIAERACRSQAERCYTRCPLRVILHLLDVLLVGLKADLLARQAISARTFKAPCCCVGENVYM